MKRFIKILIFAVAAAALGIIAGCAGCVSCGGCAGCGGSQTNSVLTSSNWYTGTSYPGIQPSFIVEDGYADYAERLEYGVAFEKPESANSSYSVNYSDGEYTTEFYAVRFDWNGGKTLDREGFRADEKEVLYCFKTLLKIKVQYELKNGDKSEVFEDSVETESYFRAAGKSLQPVYSYRRTVSASPAGYSASAVDEAYEKIDVTYENYYDRECKNVIYFINGEEQDAVELDDLSNTLFDNDYLYIAIRSMTLTENFSKQISLFSGSNGLDDYTVSGSSKTLSENEIKQVSAALEKKGLFKPQEDATTVRTVAADINIASGKFQGTTQTVWYAALPENKDSDNVSRSTLLKISIPVPYNLGTLNLTLSKVNSTLWNN